MDLFGKTTFNGKYGSNSAKPIAGVATNSAYKRTLSQAVIAADIAVGQPCAISVGSTTSSVNAGKGFAPNVLQAKAVTGTSSGSNIAGFIVSSPTDVLDDGDEFAIPRAGQVAFVAQFGSGTEMYLPCDATAFANKALGVTNAVAWDVTNNKLVASGTASATLINISNIAILSQVVDGVVATLSNGKVTVADASVIKVRI